MKQPLTPDQIAAAVEIRSRLSTWQDADAALSLVRREVPGFSPPESLLKVVTVNSL